jgi:flavin-dependent dehydrogenase
MKLSSRRNHPPPECDVIVFGGGPAGAAAAISLARAGHSVVVIEKSHYERARIGETLPPAVTPLLAELGVWELFRSAEHLPSPGLLSVWGTDELYETHFIFNPYGQGWHLDRQRFDAMLVEAARQAGAHLCCGGLVTSCLPLSGDRWEVGFTSVSQSSRRQHRVRARFLIDATGRAAALARRQGAKRLNVDRLVGLAGVLAARSRMSDRPEEACDSCTLVEACAEGWWYSALLPSGQLIAVYMTDADLLRRCGGAWDAFWSQRLRQTIHTQLRMVAFDLQAVPRVVAASSSRLDYVSGRSWLAVGDAGMAFDPLSSQGLMEALASGIRGGRTLNARLAGEVAAIGEYEMRANDVFGKYLRLRAVYYGRENRWPQSEFWQRRHRAA